MFKKIFGFGGKQHVVGLSLKAQIKGLEDAVVEAKKEVPLNISEPVYTIVEKVRENPERLKFTNITHYLERLPRYVVEDRITHVSVVVRIGDLSGFDPVSPYKSMDYLGIESEHITFTRDEVDYIERELKPILEEFHKERQNLLTNIRDSRRIRQEVLARERMLKLFEGS